MEKGEGYNAVSTRPIAGGRRNPLQYGATPARLRFGRARLPLGIERETVAHTGYHVGNADGSWYLRGCHEPSSKGSPAARSIHHSARLVRDAPHTDIRPWAESGHSCGPGAGSPFATRARRSRSPLRGYLPGAGRTSARCPVRPILASPHEKPCHVAFRWPLLPGGRGG